MPVRESNKPGAVHPGELQGAKVVLEEPTAGEGPALRLPKYSDLPAVDYSVCGGQS